MKQALDSKEEREDEWRRKFSSAIYARDLLQEVAPPTVAVNDILALNQSLDDSQNSWSSLELSGVLSPDPLSTPPSPSFAPPPPPPPVPPHG